MATGGWVADLDRKEHKNWVMVGCVLNITKNGITPKIQTEIEAWYQSLITSPPLNLLTPCTCSSRSPKCPTCVTWETELMRLHTSRRPKICWGNSDRKQWGSPTGAWEIAKVFMPTLGSRKKDVVDAKTTGIGGLLNLLEWCPFIKPPVSGKVLSLARDQCRNHWAHAPNQELKDADVPTIFGHLNSLLTHPAFTADKAAQNACKDLQELFRQGLVNIRDSEVEGLHLLRQSLVADLAKCRDDLTNVQDNIVQLDAETKKETKMFQKDISELKEKDNTSREEIGNLSTRVKEVDAAAKRDISEVKEQSNRNKEGLDRIETKLTDAKASLSGDISTILHAVDDFNTKMYERDDMRGAFEVIREDVDDVRYGVKKFLMELTTTKSRMAKLDTNFTSMKGEVKEVKSDIKEVAGAVSCNKEAIFGLERDVMDVKAEVETLKGKTSETNGNDDHLLCTAPSRLTAFTGRKSPLEWLERKLISDGREKQLGTSCNTKSICGLGGCGKTSLAVEFAWSCMNRFPGGIFWINGESDENIQKSVVEILALQNIPASTTENIDDTLNRFLAWLCKKTVPWLLVMDNADDLQGPMLPTGVKKICSGSSQRNGNALKQGHILFTTRQNAKDTRSFLKVSSDDCLELQCFSEEEGTRFLIKRIGLKEESLDPEAIYLVSELGALPLALEQAAAFISASPIPLSFKDYLDKYQAVKLRLLSQQPATAVSVEAQHRLSVHTTWEMNFEFVREQSPAAASMIYIAAFLQSENIPFDIINPGYPELDQEDLRNCARSKVDIATMLRVLSSYSLFSVHHPSRTFSVHKLVQEVVRDSLTSSGRIEALGAAIRVLHSALREKSKPCFRLAKYNSLTNLSEIKEEERNVLINLVLNFRQLKNHMEDEVNSLKGSPLFNDHTLELCNFVSSLLSNNIFFESLAAELSYFNLKVAEIRGNSDPNFLLASMVSSCVSKRNCPGLKNQEEAKKLALKAVQKLVELESSGAIIENDTKYRVFEHRASYYALEGDWEKNYKALRELEALSISDENIVDLQILIGRAENYMSTGNFRCVLRRYEKALELARRIYPSNHYELLRVLQFITTHLQLAGKDPEARKYAEEMLEVAKKQPPASDYFFRGVTSALSVLRFFDPDGAEVTLLRILEDRWPLLYRACKSQMVDSRIDSYLADIVNEGSSDHAAMVLNDLLECFAYMLKSSSQPKDWTHLKNREKVNFYRRIAEMFFSLQKKEFGDIHPQIKQAYSSLVVVHLLLGNQEEADKFKEKVTQCKELPSNKHFSEARPNENVIYARRYKDKGNNFFKSENFVMALEHYSEALKLCPNDAVLLTNRAATFVRLSTNGQNQAGVQRNLLGCALKDSEKAITVDPSWVKGYFWKAVCLAKLKEKGRSLAAAAIAKHLSPSNCAQIPAVVEQFGGYNAIIVNTVEDLICNLETAESNSVIVVKKGIYKVPNPLRVPRKAVIAGVGEVQIVCTKGVPLQLDETIYIENITLSPTMESITKLKERAKECLNRGQLDMALSLYSDALTTCPNDAQLLTARATTFLESANKKRELPSERRYLLELALKDSEAAIVADSSWVLGYYNKAVSLAELERKHQALAATAVFKHLTCDRDIPVVTQRFGDVTVQAVENSDELRSVLHRIEELNETDQVVLLKEGEYRLDKIVEVAQAVVMVGVGKVTVSCKTGQSPFYFTQEHCVENVELCGGSQNCTDSCNTQAEEMSLPGLSEDERTNLSSECKVN